MYIIGCGSVGSTIGVILAKMGFSNFVLIDPDTVEIENVSNQMFNIGDIGYPKCGVLAKRIYEESPRDTADIIVLPRVVRLTAGMSLLK